MSIRWLLLSIAASSFFVSSAAFAQQSPPTLPPPAADTAPLPPVTLPPAPPAPPGAVTIVPATPNYAPPTAYAPGYGPPASAPGYGPPATTPGYGSPAYGQPAYGSPAPYSRGYPPPPPYLPPPPVEQGVHLHDGFYLRMAVGMSYLSSTITPKQGATETVRGTGAAIEFGMGGAVADGFILGGKLSSMMASQPEAKTDSLAAKVDGSLELDSLQFFADFYPMPEEGFHLQAGIGPASLRYNPSSSRADSKSTGGFAGSIGVGWEGWVGKQWGIGALFNLNVAKFTDNSAIPTLNGSTTADTTSSISVVVPTLLFTATLN